MANRSRIEQFPKLIYAIAADVAAGSYASVVAASYGIPRRTFAGWIELGHELRDQSEGGEELPPLSRHETACIELATAVEEALAQAEKNAGERVFDNDPKAWLTMGPARERWRKESRVEIDATMEHSGSIEIPCPAPIGVLAAGLAELEAIGLDVHGDRKLFRQLPAPDDGNGEPKVNGDDHS